MRGKKVYRILLILPVRLPGVPVGAGLGGHAEPELRLHQPGAARRRRHPLAHRSVAREVQRALREPVARLPVHVPRVHGRAAVASPRTSARPATVDGASAWRIFRRIKLPLLLVTVAPLLIAIVRVQLQQLQRDLHAHRRRPALPERRSIPVGATDILITMVYKVAFSGGGGRDYGLASAFSILIFIIVDGRSRSSLPADQGTRGPQLMSEPTTSRFDDRDRKRMA